MGKGSEGASSSQPDANIKKGAKDINELLNTGHQKEAADRLWLDAQVMNPEDYRQLVHLVADHDKGKHVQITKDGDKESIIVSDDGLFGSGYNKQTMKIADEYIGSDGKATGTIPSKVAPDSGKEQVRSYLGNLANVVTERSRIATDFRTTPVDHVLNTSSPTPERTQALNQKAEFPEQINHISDYNRKEQWE